MEKVEIFDTTCRDGEQATKGFIYGIESKLLLSQKLADLNVSTIEAGFPISSPGDFQAVQKIARGIQGPYICALARTKSKDIKKAWEAIKDNPKPTIHTFTFMVDPKSLAAYGLKEFNKVIQESVDAVKHAKDLMNGQGRVEFSAQNATIGNREQMYEIYSKVIEAGADIVNLPDTAGYSFPNEIFNFVSDFMKNTYNTNGIIVSTHCHNDLGNATANSVAAVMAGARQIECTINGIGERAGNAALEEVVMNIETRKKTIQLDTSINTKLFGEISRLVSEHSRTPVQPNKSIVGSNAFNHSSGIHQDGVEKGAGYEIMSPESVGWDGESFEITSRSGKSGYVHRLERLGYDSKTLDNYIKNIVEKGKELSDEIGQLEDVDLRFVTDEEINPIKQRIIYKNKHIEDNNGEYTAEVVLEIDGQEKIVKATDKGPVDALCSAVDSAVKEKIPTLVVYDPRNIGRDHSATAEVTIVLSSNGPNPKYHLNEPIFVGRARNKDTLEASIMAYVSAVNRYLTEIN